MTEPAKVFWTRTVWGDEASTRAWRGQDAHRRAMPKLRRWCNEASVLHWHQDGDDLPEPEEARRGMMAEGRTSRVDRPSPAHQEGRIAAAPVPSGPVLTSKHR